MSSYVDSLIKGLHAGFVDKSIAASSDYIPQLLTNDRKEGKRVLSSIESELKKCQEFCFSVAFVTTGGVATILQLLKEITEKGVKGKVLVSQYLNFTQPEALRRLKQLENIDLRMLIQGALHAKGYIFQKKDGYSLIIGSSNLTDSALKENKEWNLKVSATADSDLVNTTLSVFEKDFADAVCVDDQVIIDYELIYKDQLRALAKGSRHIVSGPLITPNAMQVEALKNLADLRRLGHNRALLISATGTGKTFLSAFDVRNAGANRVLFVVHRENIAKAAMESFTLIFGATKKMGLYSGSHKDTDAAFVFSMIQTLSKEEHLKRFSPDYFDYIIIDETHRAGAQSYQRITDYFKPKFLLGMTATPERMDGFDIFSQFNHNVAYEIRLHKALEENMLSPFHYYGIADISVNNQIIEEDAAFNLLTSDERVTHIIEKAKFYGCDDGVVRGLVFCSKIDEANSLSEAFNHKGYRTVALTGSSTEQEREAAINRLESGDSENRLDYIFTVDIFNEGVDIPRVNQIIMLRPTQSPIIFVQQLGRGLRKTPGKQYLTVIDFIGNYANNYMIPLALYGDSSYNKDRLRKLVTSGSQLIPGASTVSFDRITKERIYNSINLAKLNLKRDLDRDYDLLKFELGRHPLMMDFLYHGSRDPHLYVDYSKSLYSYAIKRGPNELGKLTGIQQKFLELTSRHVADGKRIEEIFVLKSLIGAGRLTIDRLKSDIKHLYNYDVTSKTIASCVGNINLSFATKESWEIVSMDKSEFKAEPFLITALENTTFKTYFLDVLNYAESLFNKKFENNRYVDGFFLYEKYTRKDVLRILNWEKIPVLLNVGGYIVHPDKSVLPIFVTYEKSQDIADTIKYEDKFLNRSEFLMISKSKRTLSSPEIVLIRTKKDLRLPLFVKKSDDEDDFYYLGDLVPKAEGFEGATMRSDTGMVNIVRITFDLKVPVEEALYDYFVMQE
jgi:superfamily II DNA or RNA helicase/HKD family nuclease